MILPYRKEPFAMVDLQDTAEQNSKGQNKGQYVTDRTPAKQKPKLPETPRAQGGGSGGGGGGGSATPDQYTAQANALYQQLMARGPFQYDLQGDMFYRQYADQYTDLGKLAMQDAMGTAAGLTGGYGNSYAEQVGQQAYQQYLTQLNAMIPEFYDRAYQAYMDEGDLLLQKYQLAQAQADAEAARRASASGGSGGGSSGKSNASADELAALLSTLKKGTGTSQQAADMNALLGMGSAQQSLLDELLLNYNLYGYYQ